MAKRPRGSPSNLSKRHKTAIEQEIEEAEEYERQKETEQRRAQELKLLSVDEPTTKLPAVQYEDRLMMGRSSKLLVDPNGGIRDTSQLEASNKAYSSKVVSTDSRLNRPDVTDCSIDHKDETRLKCEMLGKLRLPRSLLEKWVEEPFFERAVVGCFVRLGVGKAPGVSSEAQYKVCEIVSVGKYKHPYTFGEFETTKALMLKIGRNERLWRMNVISNHRFADSELEEWLNLMRTERQRIPSASEIDERKAQMRKAVFGHSTVAWSASRLQDEDQLKSQELVGQRSSFDWNENLETMATYSEADVARIVSARRKRSEAARFRERQSETVTRLNHGQTRTRYEHEVYSARDAYAALLIAQSKSLVVTPSLAEAVKKVEQTETWQLDDNDSFERDLDVLASKLSETRHVQLPSAVTAETEECRKARIAHRNALKKLLDFRKNALDQRKKRDVDAPSRTSVLHSINEAKKA